MEKLMDWNRLGSALQGMGEGFAGRGSQWRYNQLREKELEQERKMADARRRQELSEAEKAEAKRMFAVGAYQARELYKADDVDGARAALQNLRVPLSLVGTDQEFETLESILRAEPAGLGRGLQMLGGMAEQSGLLKQSAGEDAKTSAMTRMLADGSILQTDNQGGTRLVGADGAEVTDPLARAAAIKEAQEIEREQARLMSGARAAGKVEAEGGAGRLQETINMGISAARTMPVINRTRELLDTVETGGWNAAALKAKKFFGIEGADEGQLSANLGKAVLSQLRDTFGAAFTEREGARLDAIEANFGNNTKTNIRLIEQLMQLSEFKYDRGVKAAKEAGDFFAVKEMNSWRNMRLGDEAQKPAAPSVTAPQAPSIKFLGFE